MLGKTSEIGLCPAKTSLCTRILTGQQQVMYEISTNVLSEENNIFKLGIKIEKTTQELMRVHSVLGKGGWSKGRRTFLANTHEWATS